MKYRNYLLTALAAFAFSPVLFAQDNDSDKILGDKIFLEQRSKYAIIESEPNPEPYDLEMGDFEAYLDLNKNSMSNLTSEAIEAEVITWRVLPALSTYPDGWKPFQLCDNVICYADGIGDPWYSGGVHLTNAFPPSSFQDFYTTMYIPTGSTAEYGEIVVEITYDDAVETFVDTLYFGFVNSTVGVNELYKDQLSVYPNPSNDVVNVSLNNANAISQVLVFDMVGRQQMVDVYANGNAAQLDVAGLSAGLYLLRIEDGNGNYTFYKIQKN